MKIKVSGIMACGSLGLNYGDVCAPSDLLSLVAGSGIARISK
jgi:hypothetical protein